MKVHLVFHVSLLEPYHLSTIPDRTRPPPLPIIVESESEYEMEEILDFKYHHKCLFYLVKWKSYNLYNNSWEPASFVKNAPHLIEAFHVKYLHHFKPTIFMQCSSLPLPLLSIHILVCLYLYYIFLLLFYLAVLLFSFPFQFEDLTL